MHHRVDHRLEDRAFAELRHVDARRILVRRHPPIAGHEAHRLANLLVERTGDVPGVELPAGVHAVAAVAHGLDPRVRQPLPRVVRGQQHAADGRAQRAMPVVLQELQLRQGDLGRLIRARAHVLPPQRRAQAADPGVPHDLGVAWRRRPTARAPATAGGPPRNPSAASCLPADGSVRPETGAPSRSPESPRPARHRPPVPAAGTRKMPKSSGGLMLSEQISVTRFAKCIQLRGIEPLRLPVVRYPQNETAATSVGERREIVGEIVATRTDNAAAAESNFLQLEIRVFTECDLFPQARCVGWHGSSRCGPTPCRIGLRSNDSSNVETVLAVLVSGHAASRRCKRNRRP